MKKFGTTLRLEEWFSNSYAEYQILCNKTDINVIDEVQKKSEEIFTLMNIGNMTLTEINTLTDKERYFLSKWFLEKAKNEIEIYKNKFKK